ncbi:MAG: hypothetical protein CAF45_000935 [Nitrospira sp. CG24E]|nr:MAG: hypothetical protein CAF45_000935 [Nitrospira sp. CG24E]
MEGMRRMFGRVATHLGVVAAFMFTIGGPASLSAQTPPAVSLTVNDGAGSSISTGFRWLLQEDQTFLVAPGIPNPNSLSYNFHRSYMPVVDKGEIASGGAATVAIPDPTKRYFISVLPHCATPSTPDLCYSISGVSIAAGQTNATVVVPSQRIPTAQIFVMAFEDKAPINNALDQGERGLGGFNVLIADAGGPVLTDAFGNPLGTFYNPDGSVYLLGSGVITTITQAEINAGLNPYNLRAGEAVIKNLPPGKYGVTISPLVGANWQQTSTIEGTKTIDAWVKAKEPRYSFELGPAGHHAEFGYVQPFNALVGGGSLSGRIVNMHMSRPPDYTMHKGHPLPGCWVGLNELLLGRAGRGLYVAACNADSTFTVPNVPPGTYQLAVWDQFLDNIFALVPVTVTGAGQDLGDVGVFRWFGAQDHYVFFDDNENGVRDSGEVGIRDQAVNLRFRDGSIYQSFPTDVDGFVPFDEIFPFFSWQVAEVDFARFKATGVTVTVDAGGPVAPGEKLTPQIQADGASTRTETGPVLLEGFQSFLGTTNKFEWGKKNYAPGENGGISGIVQYATTRAENDPAYAGAETWEPGIPRVPLFLYRDQLGDNIIDDVNGSGTIELADVDHYPFGWRDGSGTMGPEDVKRNDIGGTAGTNDPAFTFNAGDAVQIASTDSWDDSLPTDCPGNPLDPFYQNGKCYDGLRNFNQVRPAVFDGGYAFTTYIPGGWLPTGAATPLVAGKYIVEAVTPKGYEHQTEESKNVDFGDAPVVSPLALPPACVGELHRVPPQLTLFPGVAAPNAGADTPLCDRKAIALTSGANPGVNFFMYTDVPVAAQVKGFILNDLANEFNPLSPNFSEKAAPSWLPVSFRDWTGREIVRVYTDQFGSYNAMVPSTYTINAPTPSGVAPHMMQICLNSPGPITDAATGQSVIDPFYNKQYGQVCWTLHMEVGKTLYADTPILPVAAFVGPGNVQTDCECADKTPKIFSVTAAGNGVGGGPFIADVGSRQLTITSVGSVQVPDPNAIRTEGNLGAVVTRDFGFGTTEGVVTIGGIPGVPLQNVTWSNSVITGDVPVGAPTGELIVKRADSGFSTANSVVVTVGNAGIPNVRTVAPGQSIQAALDAAVANDLILVQPGTYYEMLIMTKPVKLQGFGAASTHIIASQSQTTQLQTWREKMNVLVNCPPAQGGGQITLLPGQLNNTPVGLGGTGTCGFVPGTGLFKVDEGAGIFVAARINGPRAFNNVRTGRIDGFSVAGSATSPGIVVNGYARYLEISNNQVTNNQGTYGGGIRLGDPTITASAQNDHAFIHHNHIVQNGSQFSPGAGVALYTGSDNYWLTDNYICGNFATEDGGGVAHYGLSRDGLIGWNKIVFNQTFVQAVGGLGGSGAGGGLLVAGVQPVVGNPNQISAGAGSVAIVSNLIQGNNAGTGDGGGLLLQTINGLDVLASPLNSSTWYHVELFNNIIVNNVAGLAGGGIAMQDVAMVKMINNTVAHNDSTATAGLAFSAGVPNVSNPQPAGIVSSRHSAGLCQAFGQAAGCPRYTDPAMENNIVLNNRSMFWEVNTQVNPPVGQVKIAGVHDLKVLPEGSGFLLHPMNGILTDGAAGYDPSNQLVVDSTSVFANPYFNAPPGFGTVQPDGTILQLESTTTLATAAALDEGGNFIDVHYGPLTPGGSYHLSAGSPAIDAGNDGPVLSFPFLAFDYDGQPRPTDGNDPADGIARTDIGADERSTLASPPPSAVVKFTLRNAGNDQVIVDSLTNGAIVDRLVLCGNNCPVNIEAVTIPSPAPFQSIVLTLSGATSLTRSDNTNPYTMPGNNGGDYLGVALNPGAHTLTATPYSGPNGTGIARIPLTISFTVVGPPQFTSTAVTTATIGDLYTYDVDATTLATGSLTYSLTQVPPATRGVMTIDSGTGVISWTPAIPNPNASNPLVSYSNNVTVRATDAMGRFTNQTFTIAVSPKPETITVTSAVFHNLAGTINDSWTISGTSTVTVSNCTGTPNVCGNLTIRRTTGNALIGNATVEGSGNWTFTKVQPGVVQAVAGDTIRILSATGVVLNNVPITIQPN